MRYFNPVFKVATLAEKQTQLLSKIGGWPWGLPLDLWPSCCGHPQRLLAQLCHEPPFLDLGNADAVLHLFQCLECLGIDDCGRDAVLISRSQLTDQLVSLDEPGYEPEEGHTLIGEIWISGWNESDDGIPASRLNEFYVERSLWNMHEEFPNIEWFDIAEKTKFGGSPRWTGNGPMGFPPAPFEFLCQFDNDLCLFEPLPTANEVGCGIEQFPLRSIKPFIPVYHRPDPDFIKPNAPWSLAYEPPNDFYTGQYTNLGTDGVIYAFIDRTQTPHKVKWFWNR